MPLADIAKRAFNWEIVSATLEDSVRDRQYDLRQFFKTLEISISSETMESEVAVDPVEAPWRYPRIRSREWTVNCTAAVNRFAGTADQDSGDGLSWSLFEAAMNSEDGNLVFSLEGPANTDGDRIRVYGQMTPDTSELSLGGEEAEQSLTLVGYGPPTVEIITT
jgi:hypothetical protein